MTTSETSRDVPLVQDQRLLGRRDVMPTVAAALGAAGVAILCWAVIGWHSALGVAVTTFVSFVVILTLAEFMARDADEVDLVEAERGEGEVADERPPEPDSELEPEQLPPVVLAAVPDAADVGDEPEQDRPVKRKKVRGSDLVEGLVAAFVAAAFAELLRIVFRMDSLVGVVIWWYIAFLFVYFLLVRDRADSESALDHVVTVVVWSFAALVSAVLVWMVLFVLFRGLPKLAATFFTQDLSKVGPLSPGGGAKHAIIGTLEQVGIATIIVVPIAILTAIYLNEINGRLAGPVRFVVDSMSGLPSIVAGLLVYTVLVTSHGFSGLAGSLALVILMLPTVTRTSEEILRTIPGGLREGGLALGAPEWRLARRVVLPTALAGLVTAVILGVARAIGETAPNDVSNIGADTTNTSPVHGPQDDLPLFVWKLIRSPEDTQVKRGFTGALVLVMLIFVLFVIARLVANRGQRKLGRVR